MSSRARDLHEDELAHAVLHAIKAAVVEDLRDEPVLVGHCEDLNVKCGESELVLLAAALEQRHWICTELDDQVDRHLLLGRGSSQSQDKIHLHEHAVHRGVGVAKQEQRLSEKSLTKAQDQLVRHVLAYDDRAVVNAGQQVVHLGDAAVANEAGGDLLVGDAVHVVINALDDAGRGQQLLDRVLEHPARAAASKVVFCCHHLTSRGGIVQLFLSEVPSLQGLLDGVEENVVLAGLEVLSLLPAAHCVGLLSREAVVKFHLQGAHCDGLEPYINTVIYRAPVCLVAVIENYHLHTPVAQVYCQV